jgi:cold-inducible RNA-binding protein
LRLFVARLPRRVQSIDLRVMFEQWGAVEDAYVLTNRETGESRGCGFVTMPNHAEALRALNEADQMVWDGRRIVVEEAKERERTS